MLTQRVMGPRFEAPLDAVRWLGAVQAQDYLGALWAIGLRTRGATEAAVERAIADRLIVRTWPMRGTLHFVAAADARWMLALLTPKVIRASAARLRQLDLDEAVFARSRDLLARALEGGRRLSRDAIYALLRDAGISPAGQRGIHILWRLAQERLVCFASREGKQHTFALLEEWLPPARALERDEALAELATRYFTGHGPSTLEDFGWWSGLPAALAREALELAKPRLAREVVGDRVLWASGAERALGSTRSEAYLLPAFDELLVGYRDRSASLDPAYARRVGNLLSPTLVHEGQVVGTWTRSFRKDTVEVRTTFFERAAPSRARAVAEAAAGYGAFVGRRVVLP